jgi:hypothetical protein
LHQKVVYKEGKNYHLLFIFLYQEYTVTNLLTLLLQIGNMSLRSRKYARMLKRGCQAVDSLLTNNIRGCFVYATQDGMIEVYGHRALNRIIRTNRQLIFESEDHETDYVTPRAEADSMFPLLDTPLEKVSHIYLRRMVTAFVKQSGLCYGPPTWGVEECRPQWWPHNILWHKKGLKSGVSNAQMRNLITCCYEHHGQPLYLQGNVQEPVQEPLVVNPMRRGNIEELQNEPSINSEPNQIGTGLISTPNRKSIVMKESQPSEDSSPNKSTFGESFLSDSGEDNKQVTISNKLKDDDIIQTISKENANTFSPGVLVNQPVSRQFVYKTDKKKTIKKLLNKTDKKKTIKKRLNKTDKKKTIKKRLNKTSSKQKNKISWIKFK